MHQSPQFGPRRARPRRFSPVLTDADDVLDSAQGHGARQPVAAKKGKEREEDAAVNRLPDRDDDDACPNDHFKAEPEWTTQLTRGRTLRRGHVHQITRSSLRSPRTGEKPRAWPSVLKCSLSQPLSCVCHLANPWGRGKMLAWGTRGRRCSGCTCGLLCHSAFFSPAATAALADLASDCAGCCCGGRCNCD
jgi:hypothetical protein